jgi:hypothetical protein
MDETIKEIEIALRDGLIDELVTTTENGIELIRRLSDVVSKQDAALAGWEALAAGLRDVAVELNDHRDRAITLSVQLLDECMSCTNKEHHGPAY